MDDNELMQALKSGSEVAWDEAFRRLYPCAFAAARHPSAALSPSDAEDVAIEALSQLAARIAEVKRFEELQALTVTIAVRRAISLQRKRYAEKRGGNQTSSLDQIKEITDGQFEVADKGIGGLTEADLQELVQLLNQVMQGMDPLTKDLIHGNLLEGLTYKELAEKHAIPIGTVGVNLARGLARVRARLSQSPGLLKEVRLFLR
jgi:RNA polymerase sigma-70 factor (ECF subfamily)